MAEARSGEKKYGRGHRSRLREKFLRGGLDGFLDHEVVELLLTLGTPRRDCKRAAQEAMRRFKTLGGVLEGDPEEIQKIDGIGPRNLIGIKLIHQVSRRFLKEKILNKPVCHSSREVFDYLYHAMRDAGREMFKVMFLDAKNRILEEKTFFEGTIDSSVVYPREIMKFALDHRASSLICVHNHPSGDPQPSNQDRMITKELVFAAGVMQLKVLDHIIIGNNRYYSFADHGLIDGFEVLFQNLMRRTT